MEAMMMELLDMVRECQDRCLVHAANRAADLLAGSLATVSQLPSMPVDPEYLADIVRYQKAKTHFQLQEFQQARHVLNGARSKQSVFLWAYAAFMDIERENEECGEDKKLPKTGRSLDRGIAQLAEELEELQEESRLDAFSLWLLGVLYQRLGLDAKAGQAFVQAINARPAFINAWLDLIAVTKSAAEARQYRLPQHWMHELYLAKVAAEFQEYASASEQYDRLLRRFPKCEYLLQQAALCKYNMRDFDIAQELYEKLCQLNPYCIEGMDVYSNILYVKGLRADLSDLAHRLVKIDKYRPETCCIVGNYYSSKSQHHRAVAYFQRALKLDRRFLAAWTLVGHEYLELKNTPGAIEAYRKAIDIDPRDHRAWYGLGQAYEILHMYSYAVYYYGKACALRSQDGRMWAALGNTYKCMNQPYDAIQCYKRAETDEAADSTVLHELATLHVATKDSDTAAKYFAQYVARCSQNDEEDANSISACLFLARYYKDHKQLIEAEKLATRVLRYGGRDKEEARQLLQEIRSLSSL